MNNHITLFLASALLAFAGCTVVERIEVESVNDNQLSGKELTIEASRESSGPETKTVRESNGSVLWTPGDAISLFYGSGTDGGSRFVSNSAEVSPVTNFTGTITAITGGADISLQDTYFWGVYPYGSDVSCDGTGVTLTLPTHQTAIPGTFDTMLFPSIGRSQGLVMGFYNVCGGWRFSVTKEGVRKVTLKSNGGELIAGKVRVGLDSSGIPYIDEVIDGSDEVVLECPRGEYFEVGKNYFMVLLPGTMSSGFTMTFETYTEEGVYVRTASTKINRSGFQGVSNLDNYLSTPYHQKIGNIPIEDANFKSYLIANYDVNHDGEISYVEADAITAIGTLTSQIASVQGIEYMPNLYSLSIRGTQQEVGQITSIDLSNNHALTILNCVWNQLSSLDMSNNSLLTTLHCDYNHQLNSLNVSNCPQLKTIYCNNSSLGALDVSNNTELEILYCGSSYISALDLSSNLVLKKLSCSSSSITSLDVSENILLTHLYCEGYIYKLTSLDVTNNTNLVELYCGGNSLSSLNVSNNTALEQLSCYNDQLSALDVSQNTMLTFLNCSSNQILSLDVSNNIDITYLKCDYNQLTSLNLSMNTALEMLCCYCNQLTSLDVSTNTALESLWCHSNLITSLDVSNNSSLYNLYCSPMPSLQTLIVAQGQDIPNITSNRNDNYIPSGTQIVIAPNNGGNEGTGDEEVNP